MLLLEAGSKAATKLGLGGLWEYRSDQNLGEFLESRLVVWAAPGSHPQPQVVSCVLVALRSPTF